MKLRENHRSIRSFKGSPRCRVWLPLGQGLRPPPCMRSWLLERGSLTQRLQAHFAGVRVRVLLQETGRAFSDEGQTLHDPLGRLLRKPVVVRNVVLADEHQRPLIVAHSILPARSRGLLSVMFNRLGKQALGSVLFSRPGFVRSQREWALLDARDPLYHLVATSKAPALPGVSPEVATGKFWARRAVFSRLRSPRQMVQVSEVFCAAIEEPISPASYSEA